jgi:hypothetical protein
MQDKNDIRVQQTQQEEKPKKTKRVAWKLFTWSVTAAKFVLRVWLLLEGDSDS